MRLRKKALGDVLVRLGGLFPHAPHRSAGRDWGPVVWPDWEPLIPPRQLWVGSEDPLVHFFRWIWEYRAYLTLLCDMRRDSRVLELGCSHGRTMLGLLDYLQPPGGYEGLDIAAQQIEFAKKTIQVVFPIFNFTLADIHNAVYNPHGRLTADTYRFPYCDGTFDIVYAASLFTHLLPPSAANYFAESRRVMRDGGRCLFSFFILDFYRGTGTSGWQGYEFDYPLKGFDGVAVHSPNLPEQLVAYQTTFVDRMARDCGLEVKRIFPGYWSNTHSISVNEQDLVLLEAH
jgi:SAM-dependent methyltransferase